MQFAHRLYKVEGCSYCEKAEEFLSKHNLQVEKISNLSDPIIQAGLAILFPGRPPQFPLLVDFANSTATVGFTEEEYGKVFGIDTSSGIPNGSADEQQPSREAPRMAEEATPQAE